MVFLRSLFTFFFFRYPSRTSLSTLTDIRFALIPRYPTISLAVLYSGLFTRNNRISNATFPNRFNPSVKCFNFELIIHNPCHNSTISRIKYRYQCPWTYDIFLLSGNSNPYLPGLIPSCNILHFFCFLGFIIYFFILYPVYSTYNILYYCLLYIMAFFSNCHPMFHLKLILCTILLSLFWFFHDSPLFILIARRNWRWILAKLLWTE